MLASMAGCAQYLKPLKPSLKVSGRPRLCQQLPSPVLTWPGWPWWCQVVAVEPKESNVMSGGQAGPHKIQGIGAGFIPRNADMALFDEIMQVGRQACADRLADALARWRRQCGPAIASWCVLACWLAGDERGGDRDGQAAGAAGGPARRHLLGGCRHRRHPGKCLSAASHLYVSHVMAHIIAVTVAAPPQQPLCELPDPLPLLGVPPSCAPAVVCPVEQVGSRPENANKKIVVVIPSFGERYLSTALFQNLWDEASKLVAADV